MSDTLTLGHWQAGERHFETFEGSAAIRADTIIQEFVGELRKRLGGAFTVDELVELYGQGAPWALSLATRLAPSDPPLWDARLLDAAFFRYVRRARDWSGGRVIYDEQTEQ